jgi:hypothetical protein
MKMMKFKPTVDYRGIAGTMLRGKNVYGAGGTSPNPSGINQYRKLAALKLKRKAKIQNGLNPR